LLQQVIDHGRNIKFSFGELALVLMNSRNPDSKCVKKEGVNPQKFIETVVRSFR